MSAIANGNLDDTYEDMSIESDGNEDEEAALNAQPPASVTAVDPLPTIELSFGNSKGGAWDDRELIKAYDTALDEFHAHHPGPGSWLDKATAAMAKGKPLPAASTRGTLWYSASAPTNDTNKTNGLNPPAKSPRRIGPSSQRNGISSNPYTPTTAGPSRPTRTQRASPTYAPPSPSTENAEPYDGQYDESHVLPVPPQTTIPPQAASSPSYGVQPIGGISTDDAYSYAMTAQYWAGYWMGVAQARSQNAAPDIRPTQRPSVQAQMEYNGVYDDVENSGPRNVIVTRKQFSKPFTNGLKR